MVTSASQQEPAGGAEFARVVEIVSRATSPGLEPHRAIDRLAGRRGDRARAHAELEAALRAGAVHRAQVDRVGTRASTYTVLRPGPPPTISETGDVLTGDQLECLLRRAHRGQRWLADQLRKSQPCVSQWVATGVPRARQGELRELLAGEIRVWVATSRQAAGNPTQSELGAQVDADQVTVSEWLRACERDPLALSDARWTRLETALERATEAASAAPRRHDVETELTVEALERLLRAARRRGVSQAQAARLCGVTPPVLIAWRKRRRPIPPARWRRIRVRLRAAHARPPIDEVEELLVPAVVALVRRRPGMLRTRLADAFEQFGEAALRRAISIALERRKVHLAPTLVELPSGRRRRYPALYRGAAPTAPPPPRDRALELVPLALEAIAAAAGDSRRAIADRLPVDAHDARAAVERALALGLAHEERVPFTSARGDRRTRVGVLPGPAPADPAAPRSAAREIPPLKLRAERQRLGLTRAELAKRLAASIGASPFTVRGWLSRGVPALRTDEVRVALARLEPAAAPADEVEREELLRRRIVELVRAEPGLLRRGDLLTRASGRDRALFGRALRAAVEGGDVHQHPSERRNGRTHLIFDPGPPPPEHESGPPLTAEEFAAALERSGLRPTELADRLGVPRSAVSQWRAGASIPAGRRAQVRAVLHASAEAARQTKPRGLSGRELRRRRQATRLRQQDFADRLPGITQLTVSRWERCGVPLEYVERVEAALANPDDIPHFAARSLERRRQWGAELREAREARGLTQAELGAIVGRSGSWVSALEAGRSKASSKWRTELERLLAAQWRKRARA